MTCQDVEHRELVSAYAHGRLTGDERDAFETHFLECATCFDAIQNYRVLHGLLAARAGHIPTWRRPSIWFGFAAAAVLAVAIIFTLRPGPEPRQLPRQAGSRPSEPAPPPQPNPAPRSPSRAVLIEQLARVEPPAYVPPSLRGAEDDARRAFASAMEPYRSGNYARAAEALGVVARRSPASAEAAFYLAVSHLMIGRLEEAAAGFERVLALDDLLFEEDAHFFLGKVRLSQGDIAAARREFQTVVEMDGDRRQQARALVTALDPLLQR